MKLMVLGLLVGMSAHAFQAVCPSATTRGSTVRLEIKEGKIPAKLTGDHRYNNNSSYVALDCDKTSKIVASAVKYTCADGTYGVDYAQLSLSPLAFQKSSRFPVKLTYLDENTGEPSGGTEVFNCSYRRK